MHLSDRVRAISPSPTVGIDTRAKEMARQGVDVINLGAGEPDFDTPEFIKEAARQAINEGFTKYTPVAGIPELRRAICEKLERDNGLSYEPAQILVSNGAKQVLYQAYQAVCEPGDEAIVIGPYWVSYTEMVKLAGAEPVVVPTREEDGFVPDPDAIAEKVTPRTRVINLNSPNNPAGSVYPRRALEAIAELAVRHDLWVFSDEIYEKLVYDGAEHVSIASLGPEIKRRTLVVNGVSKAYAMTGWRMGYGAGDRDLIRAMDGLQGHLSHGISSITQRACVAALTGSQEPVAEMRREFDRRRRLVVDRLNAMPGITCPTPRGAFYAYPNVSGLFGRRARGKVLDGSSAVAGWLLEEGRIAAVPGVAFGDDRFLRLSYATAYEAIAEAMDRMASLVAGLER